MTEKTRLLESAISEIDRVLLGNKSADVNEVYLNNAKRYIRESMTDLQPAFAVGEYYARGEYIYRVEETDNIDVYVSAFNAFASIYFKASWSLDDIVNDKPATAEQIAEFKRAEHFASKGRKLDEFRVGDKVTFRDCELFIGNVYIDLYGKNRMNASDEHRGFVVPEADFCNVTLIQTAEELQEVADNE